eukprot:NODE_732_length_4716_cov_0.429500.p3 type:complete len:211 gc:universal NODE_732_length_4716_cov_0.429500:3773-4405(+)
MNGMPCFIQFNLISAKTIMKQKFPISKLTFEQHNRLSKWLRVNHAGEVGANYIYAGQLNNIEEAVKPLIKHMKEQEEGHLKEFNRILPEANVRPSLFLPLWKIGGYLLGTSTALLGKEMAMLCTESVETAIGQHYNDQLRELIELSMEVDSELKPFLKELQTTVSKFRDEELEHKDIAIKHNSTDAPLYKLASRTIQGGCWFAIEIAKRI